MAWDESVSEYMDMNQDLMDESESLRDRLTWYRIRNKLRIKTMWGRPFAFFLIALALAASVPLVDKWLNLNLVAMDKGTLISVLGGVSAATLTLSGLVFTALTTAMQLGISSLSVRVVPILQQDPVMLMSMGAFIGTFGYSMLLGVEMTLGPEEFKPVVAYVLAIALAIICGVLLIATVARVCRILNPGQLLLMIADQGYKAMDDQLHQYRRNQPKMPHRKSSHGGSIIRMDLRRGRGNTLLAVNSVRLLSYESKWDVEIELLAVVGSALPYGLPVFRVSGETTRRQRKRLMRCLAFGETYAPTSGPVGAIRAMVDIALKALSPAINDPSRAVQVLDELEAILAYLSRRIDEDNKRVEDSGNQSIVRGWTRTWEDYVAISTDEIRQYGTTSIQIQRRLRNMFESLLELCAPNQKEPLQTRLELLDAQTDSLWTMRLDRELSLVSDPQGFGSANGVGRDADPHAAPGSPLSKRVDSSNVT